MEHPGPSTTSGENVKKLFSYTNPLTGRTIFTTPEGYMRLMTEAARTPAPPAGDRPTATYGPEWYGESGRKPDRPVPPLHENEIRQPIPIIKDTEGTVRPEDSEAGSKPADDEEPVERGKRAQKRFERRLDTAIQDDERVNIAKSRLQEAERQRVELLDRQERRRRATEELRKVDPDLVADVRDTFRSHLEEVSKQARDRGENLSESTLRRQAAKLAAEDLRDRLPGLPEYDPLADSITGPNKARWDASLDMIADASFANPSKKIKKLEESMPNFQAALESEEDFARDRLESTIDDRPFATIIRERISNLKAEIKISYREKPVQQRLLGLVSLLAPPKVEVVTKDEVKEAEAALAEAEKEYKEHVTSKAFSTDREAELSNEAYDAHIKLEELKARRKKRIAGWIGRAAAVVVMAGAAYLYSASGDTADVANAAEVTSLDTPGGDEEVTVIGGPETPADSSGEDITVIGGEPNTPETPAAGAGAEDITVIGGDSAADIPSGSETDTTPDNKTEAPNKETSAHPELKQGVIEAFDVKAGAGGYDLLNQLSEASGKEIPKSEWHRLAPDLLEKFPQDFYDMGKGEVGLRHPGMPSNQTVDFLARELKLDRI